MEQKSFIKAMRDHFGKLPGQTLGDFQNELKALDDGDRAYFTREFTKIGVEITQTAV